MSRFTLLSPIWLGLLSVLLNPLTVATPAPVPAPVNGDPCGPAIQDNPNYPNTCSVAPALAPSPQPYAINCTAVYPVEKQPVTWSNCSASYQDACTKALDFRTRTGVWIWTELAEDCAIGFFLPPYKGSAQLQNFTRCVEIFTAMTDSCSTTVPPSNYGGVNLRTIPGYPPKMVDAEETYAYGDDYDFNFTGNAVNVGYPSYALAQKPLSKSATYPG